MTFIGLPECWISKSSAVQMIQRADTGWANGGSGLDEMIVCFGLWYVASNDAYGSADGGVLCCEHRVEHVEPACSFGVATPRLVFD